MGYEVSLALFVTEVCVVLIKYNVVDMVDDVGADSNCRCLCPKKWEEFGQRLTMLPEIQEQRDTIIFAKQLEGTTVRVSFAFGHT